MDSDYRGKEKDERQLEEDRRRPPVELYANY